VFERLNDLTNARAAYQAALAKDPGLTLAKRNLARLENAAAPAATSKSATVTSANDINLFAGYIWKPNPDLKITPARRTIDRDQTGLT
jgi:hypothetical protein